MFRMLSPYEEAMVEGHVGILMESRTENEIPVKFAREVFKILQKEHPLLRVKIVKKGSHYFFDENNSEIPIFEVSSSTSSFISCCLNTSIPLDQLLEVFILKSLKGDTLLTKIHHSIADGISNFHLHDSFFVYLDRLIQHKTIQPLNSSSLPLPTESYLPASILSLDRQKIAKKWHEIDPKNIRISLPYQVNDEKIKKVHRIEKSLSPLKFKKLLKKSHRHQVSVNSLICAVLLATSAHLIDTSLKSYMLSFDVPVNLRPHFDPPIINSIVFNCVGALTLHLLISKPIDIWEMAKRIEKQIHKEFDFAKVLKFVHASKEIFASEPKQVFHYTSNLGRIKYRPSSFKVREFGFHAFCEVPFLFTFATLNDCIRFFFIYTSPILSDDFMHCYTNCFIEILKKISS